jgi:hypothetical protein
MLGFTIPISFGTKFKTYTEKQKKTNINNVKKAENTADVIHILICTSCMPVRCHRKIKSI